VFKARETELIKTKRNEMNLNESRA